jgi:TolA-binding protein
MEDNLKHLELIEAYLEGNLSEEEKVDFEVRLLVDKDLEEEFELYKKIVGSFQDIRSENIRQKLQAIDDEIDSISPKPSTKFYWWAGIAACLIFVQIFLNYTKTSIPLPLEEGLPVLMGDDHNLDFQNAMQLYKSGKYDASVKRFNQLVVANPTNDTLLYFIGSAELNSQKYQEASQHFKNVSTNSNSVFYLKSKYYLAYSLYKNNQSNEAKLILQELISNNENPFVEETKLLLKEINEN